MKVFCDVYDCVYCAEGECINKEISIENGICIDCEPKEIEYKDTFYKHNRVPNKGNVPEWEEVKGNKFEFWGREMFERYDFVTDGRTGIGMCYKENLEMIEKDKEKIIEKLLKLEKEKGLSPLYREVD